MPVPFTENTGKKQRAGTPFPAADMSIPAGRPNAGHRSPITSPSPLEPVARRSPGLVFPGESRLSLTQPPPSIHPSTGRSRCDVIGGASALHFCRQQQHAARADTHERHKIRCGSERGHHLIPPPTTLLPEHRSLRASSAMKSPDLAPSLQRGCSVQDTRSRTLIGRSWTINTQCLFLLPGTIGQAKTTRHIRWLNRAESRQRRCSICFTKKWCFASYIIPYFHPRNGSSFSFEHLS